MITLDVPLAVLAVLFRRFLDSFHYNVPVQVAPATPNSTALIVLTSALYYLYKNLNRGTLVRLSSKQRQAASDLHSTTSSNKQKTSSWLLRNLRGTRNKYTLAIRQFADQSMENLMACKTLTNIGTIHTKATLNQQSQRPLPPPQKRPHHHQASHKHASALNRPDTPLNRCPQPPSFKEPSDREKPSTFTQPSGHQKPSSPTHKTRQQESGHQESSKLVPLTNHEPVFCQPMAKLQTQTSGDKQSKHQNQQCQNHSAASAQKGQKTVDTQMSCCLPGSCRLHQIKKVSFEVQTELPEMRDASTHSDMTLELKNYQHVIDLTSEERGHRRGTASNIGGGDEPKRRGRRRNSVAGRPRKVRSNKLMKRLRNGKTIASIT